jgi:O-antigen ligase
MGLTRTTEGPAGCLGWCKSLAPKFCFGVIIVILVWGPFPLGSNREWSWSILTLFVSACWLLWVLWAQTDFELQLKNAKRVWVPLALATLVLLWAEIQALPIVPERWMHPIWAAAHDLLKHPVIGAISLNRWRTLTEVTKLATYTAFCWLVYTLTRNTARASILLNAIIMIGAGYAIYAFALGIFGIQQYRLFYLTSLPDFYISGPFVQRDNFSAFEGLSAVAAVARLIELVSGRVTASKGLRRSVLSAVKVLVGSGAPLVVATVLLISVVIASASRGASFSTGLSLAVMIIILAMKFRNKSGKWVLVGVSALLIGLALISGHTLIQRMIETVGGDADAMRKDLWLTTLRMIASAPVLGLGLGTFQDAYPMYATHTLPFIMDKAHSDILEFVAGIGIPAALCWWTALLALTVQMCRGIVKRHKDQIYPLVGVAATILIATDSAIDFSLQIPAIAFLYAALVGLGISQSYSTK